MAVDTLAVGCIGTTHDFGTFDLIRFMAVQAALGERLLFGDLLMTIVTGDQGALVIHGVVVTIGAGESIALFSGVDGVVEEHFARGGMIHHAIGWVGGLWGKGSVADNTHEKENCG
jgi:hypothetical protein